MGEMKRKVRTTYQQTRLGARTGEDERDGLASAIAELISARDCGHDSISNFHGRFPGRRYIC